MNAEEPAKNRVKIIVIAIVDIITSAIDVAGSKSGSKTAGGAGALLALRVRPQEPRPEKADRDRRAQTL